MAPGKAGVLPRGEVHDIALKAAETDATKRALATFGKPFGLELYRKEQAKSLPLPAVPAGTRLGFHPDDTTPIPRPSRYNQPPTAARHPRLASTARIEEADLPDRLGCKKPHCGLCTVIHPDRNSGCFRLDSPD